MTDKEFLPGDFGEEMMQPVLEAMFKWCKENAAPIQDGGFLCSSTQEFYDQLMTKYEKAGEEE